MSDLNQADLHLPNAEDLALLEEEMAGVTPLRPVAYPPAQPPKPHPLPRPTTSGQSDSFANLLAGAPERLLDGNEEMSYLHPQHSSKILRRLGQRRYRIDSEIDLHGLTLQQAEQTVRHFLSIARSEHQQALLIIHGKGLRSDDSKPVLKNWLNAYLRRRADVIAFCSALPADGGRGAIYLLLRD